jgi:hypothetical protein
MHADLTRWTFDPTNGYRAVLMQQGRVLLDAEWNEQAAIATHHDEVRTKDFVGRAGGPEPLSGGPGPFALVDLDDGSTPAGLPWARLGITPGRYYVEGILAENGPDDAHPTAHGACPLNDQPHLRTVGSGVTAAPGLTEPPAGDGDGRYAAFLDVFGHVVTPDEAPELLEPALGGPDTAMREQTAWQVRLERLDGQVCSTWSTTPRQPRAMVAGLRAAMAAADPCDISSGGGYQRLENQLYRVEVVDVDPQPRFVWSRENGSVVASLLSIDTTSETGMNAALSLDRVGRDDDLSISQGDLVEVTSADRRLRGLPGFLAVAGPVVDLVVHVAWSGTAPTSVAALGTAPVVRRWDGGPANVSAATQDLEGGITVRFPTGGTPAVGDYWLIPARTARLAYGTSARQGTLDWPWDASAPSALPPHGTTHHRAPLGILSRTGTAWTLDADCRSLFPALTALTALDLVGGDGQEALPGAQLGEPIRVVVRRGEIPVVGVPVRFRAEHGVLDPPDPQTAATSPVVLATDAGGVAQVRWTLDPAGTPTQRLIVERLGDTGAALDVPIIATGRLSIARQVRWDAPCETFTATTVQDGLDQVVAMPMVRLLGGDGQSVIRDGQVAPELVRVVVDSPCGPMPAEVTARASDGALVAGVDDGTRPTTSALGAGAGQETVAQTDAAGVAAFVWRPNFGRTEPGDTTGSDVLRISLKGHAEISVSAQLDAGGGSRTGGLHVRAVRLRAADALELGMIVRPSQLEEGIAVQLDDKVLEASVRGLPVGRLIAERPPGPNDPPGMVQPFIVEGVMDAASNEINWSPTDSAHSLLKNLNEQVAADPAFRMIMRFQLDGWSVIGAADPTHHLNGHADVVLVGSRPTLALPTTDEITGGRFEVWFVLGRARRIILDDFIGRTRGFLERRLPDVDIRFVEVDSPGTRGGTVLGTEPAPGQPLDPGQPLIVHVARSLN